MTFIQLTYVLAVAREGSMSRAAKALFISQPSLSTAIQELEAELGVTLFYRTSTGVVVTTDGEEFLGYARQVIEQTDLIEERYFGSAPVKHQFCVSCQHYSFAVEAFVALIKKYGGREYDFRIRETQTYEIIEDVAALRSEVGVLYLNEFNRSVLMRTLTDKALRFTRLFIASPHVFVGKASPLASRERVTLADLEPYPRLSYEQGEHNAFYFAEELESTRASAKDILVRDRATLFNLMAGLDGYTISSGVINSDLYGPNIVAVPLEGDDAMEIGYITHTRVAPGSFGEHYIEELTRTAEAARRMGKAR
ncbi:LysR family transcriptional regulator [Collinsella sp. AGMB00827]|uniref:LysR family transcriptional regulator n=1 Tax=Collinsella ureilytica TaxID=2869515 RepID=A0ABS7MID0_9ACTN|nr:LysR family transcriptional regulator [Collinsella urealyticum]MBY4797127.1 LysR family transcriptional regulator [Collinsella urealyticum]